MLQTCCLVLGNGPLVAGVSRRWISQMEKGHLGSEVGRLMSVVRALGLQLQFQRDSAGADDLWAEER
ncbi:MAG: hypothetical protein OXF21_05535 [bacterium]|nr:hypothetical protein [bacterium]